MAILIENALLRDVVWADASLKSISVDYDAVTLVIAEANAHERRVRCEGYLSISMIGFWDEMIIESAAVHKAHPSIDSAVAAIESRLGTDRDASGNVARNRGGWESLVVRFGDGCELAIVAAEFHVSS